MTTPPPEEHGTDLPAHENRDELGVPLESVPQDAQASWTRRVGAVGVDTLHFMIYWVSGFVGLDVQLDPRDRPPGVPQPSTRLMAVIAIITGVAAFAIVGVAAFLIH